MTLHTCAPDLSVKPDGEAALRYDAAAGELFRVGETTERFDPWALAWVGHTGDTSASAETIAPLEAIRLISPRMRRVPVGVIGPKNASANQVMIAEALGRAIAEAGFQLLTGGKNGVMEAASKGASTAGGVTIGLVPDDEWDAANPYVTIPLATGLGPARNAVVARACEVLIAVGGEYGTLSEMAFGMHFNRMVLSLADAPEVAGVRRCETVEDALDWTARRFLRLA